jgi:hypothetical protein
MIKLKTLLKEVGEGVPPYQWSGPEEKYGNVIYYFTTEDNDYYTIRFDGIIDNEWELSFYANSDEFGVINKGRQYKIISTVMDIIYSFVKEYPVDGISFTGSDKEGSTTNQRDLLYKAYVNKNIHKLAGYHANIGPRYVNIIRDEPLDDMQLSIK